jgi:hypothetical protein
MGFGRLFGGAGSWGAAFQQSRIMNISFLIQKLNFSRQKLYPKLKSSHHP